MSMMNVLASFPGGLIYEERKSYYILCKNHVSKIDKVIAQELSEYINKCKKKE